MSSTIGKNVKVSVFGESHGKCIGVVIDGLPAGEAISFENIMNDMNRRAPGLSSISTKRCEKDVPEIISGILNNVTTGAPLCAIIKNEDVDSSSYDSAKFIPRPGHADYTSTIKYNGFNDIRGGGHFSGRLTAPITFAGSICKQILSRKGISVKATIKSIAGFNQEPQMIEAINLAQKKGDSVGGIIECVIDGVPAGIGNPMFEGLENVLSQYMFGIPGIKGIEFGLGFDYANVHGSKCNDNFFFAYGKVSTKTNNHGGILGGISSGMPIVFRVVVKPTPSITLEQHSVNLSTKENVHLNISGRHDPCIVPRAVVVVETMAALAISDFVI